MKKLAEVEQVRSVSIDCIQNDSVDIRCGGPRYLGFDFKVSAEESEKHWKEWLEKALIEASRPWLNIYVSSESSEELSSKVWSKERITKCLREAKL